MTNNTPLVSISMICYNAEPYIASAIDGILQQQCGFAIELVIGDDASTDKTREICEAYAGKFPDRIRLLPPEVNLGIGANTARTMGSCRGKYIAVCDGDDIWTDPHKLQQQVDFLESNPDYGVVYTDVETISASGQPVSDPEQDLIREMYAKGDVFVKLLQANFINNSTAVFRRDLLDGLAIAPDRCYQIPDHIRWLHIAARAKVHFLPYKSTQYRKHSSGLSVSVPMEKIRGNRRILRRSLYEIICRFDQHHSAPLSREERIVVFRRILSQIIRNPGTLAMKRRMLRLLPKYYTGLPDLIKLGILKIGQLSSHNKFILASGLKELNA